MGIIDAHHHLWDTRRLRYPLLDQIPALNRPFTIDDFEQVAVAHDVDASVCVEAASAGADGLVETAWLGEQADVSPRLKALVVWVPVERADLGNYLKRIREARDARIVGVRRSFEFDDPDFPSRADVIEGVRQIGDFGLVFDLVLFHPALPSVIELVRRCPSVQFVLDHLGKPPIRALQMEPWRSNIAELAKLENVVCKISGMTTEADHQGWTIDVLRPYFNHAIESFGWDRVMFGSDWPVCNLAGGYSRWVAAVEKMLHGVAMHDQIKFFNTNASRIYRIT